jgi:hypothetical protein
MFFLSTIFVNKVYQLKIEFIVDRKVIEQIRLQAYQRFEKAIAKSGYLSLRSIIESSYYYPRKFDIEPIRQPKIKMDIVKKERILLPQQLAISSQEYCKLKVKNQKIEKLKATFIKKANEIAQKR